jgi:acyl carrier protein
MKSELDIREELRRFFVETFLMGDTTAVINDSESFMESGIVDSTGMLEMVTFLEHAFGIKVADRELLPENLDSMDRLVLFVDRKQRAAG